jgi:7-cyano-7-deazaguanine synthase in queuosine biosynthesis
VPGRNTMDNSVDDIIYTFSPNAKMRFLNDRNLLLEKDLMVIGSIVFNIETAIRMGEEVDKVKIPISYETAYKCDLDKLKNEIEQLLNFVLIRDITIDFEIIKGSYKYKRYFGLEFEECENVCLFSGGVDSYSGIIKCKEVLKEIEGVFVAHGDQPKGVHIVETLKPYLSKFEIPINTLYAPPMKRYGYSQLRGFLYCIYGSIYVSLLNSENLLVTECGPTMYQPKFSPFDSVTMTTHPYVLEKTKNVIELLLKRKIQIITPFENLTKSEVLIASPTRKHFSETHSCISLGTGKNCGHCYGCVVRRLASITSGIKDSEYDWDPITKDFKKSENLVSLLRFSLDVLLNYENMDFTSKENIFNYKKQRLFRRFALDNFAALYILKKKKCSTNPYAENLYKEVLNRLGESKIMDRIEKVRSGQYVPNFNRRV